MSRAFVVALVGAESTGKTTLAGELGLALATRGQRVAVVGEVLREFCDREARTPRRDEQAAIAAEQTRRIDAAAADAEIVVADTTALRSQRPCSASACMPRPRRSRGAATSPC